MKRTPLRRIGRRGRERQRNIATLKDAILERSGGRCEVQASRDCARRGSQIHHRLRRSKGGVDTLSNTLFVCAPCHNVIHALPERSYEHGWLIRSGFQCLDPEGSWIRDVRDGAA